MKELQMPTNIAKSLNNGPFSYEIMNTKFIAILVMIAMVSGIAALSSPLPQQASAQVICEEKGNPDKGAEVRKCNINNDRSCHHVDTPSGKFHSSCHN